MSNYLDFTEGENTCWLTDAKFERGTNDKPRNKISLFMTDKPSKDGFDGATTRQDIFLPSSSDTVQAKIAMERRVKSVLYPIAGYPTDKKCSLKDLFAAIQANLANHDLNLSLEIQLKTGNTVDVNGNPRMFIEILTVNPIGYADKVGFESSINDDELPDSAPF